MKNTYLVSIVLALGIALGISFSAVFGFTKKSPAPQVKGLSTPLATTSSPVSALASNGTTTPLSLEDVSDKLSDFEKRIQSLENDQANNSKDSGLYEYKYVTSIDACQLNKFMKKNWQVQSNGSIVDSQSPAFDDQCVRIPYPGQVLEWALLQRKKDK